MKIIVNHKERSKIFEECCIKYNELDMAVAWVGNPFLKTPYKFITKLSKIRATIGISFYQTHPEGIRFLLKENVDLKLMGNKDGIFHPKVYVFKKNNTFAVIVGSCNFTFSGFEKNDEVFAFCEFKSKKENDLTNILKQLDLWFSDSKAFRPSKKWISKYEEQYLSMRAAQQSKKIESPIDYEEAAMPESWLGNASWNVFYQEVFEALNKRQNAGVGYGEVLETAANLVPLPWEIKYLNDMDKRKIIGGYGEYGWFGNTYASGRFSGLLKNGTRKQKRIIIDSINSLAGLKAPIDHDVFVSHLEELHKLGFGMSAWGRLLTIARPDLYASVSAPNLRKNLSKMLKVSQVSLNRPEGYAKFIKYLHATPWFNSSEPKNIQEKLVWKRRVALIDPIFY